jgi:hypothetical protein
MTLDGLILELRDRIAYIEQEQLRQAKQLAFIAGENPLSDLPADTPMAAGAD